MSREHENTLNFRWSYTSLPADLGMKIAQSQGTLEIEIPTMPYPACLQDRDGLPAVTAHINSGDLR